MIFGRIRWDLNLPLLFHLGSLWTVSKGNEMVQLSSLVELPVVQLTRADCTLDLNYRKEIPVQKTQTWRIKLNVPIFFYNYVAEYLWLPAICHDLSNKYQCLCHVHFPWSISTDIAKLFYLKLQSLHQSFNRRTRLKWKVFWTGHLVVQALHMYFV